MIRNKKQLLSLYPKSWPLLFLAEQALLFLQPKNLIRQHIKLRKNILIIDNKNFDLKKYQRIFVIGAGKATYQMAQEINKILGKKIKGGYLNVPKAVTKNIGKITVNQASHPLPNISGVKGAKKILALIKKAEEGDLIVCLMSGGGSALLPLPAQNFSLKEKISLTTKLLKCSANIHEINTVRKHISAIKGGRLAFAALPATIISLYISDVVGDDLHAIASGPTVPDPSTSSQAVKILQKYHIKNNKIEKIIKNNESPKQLDPQKVFNYIVGNNKQVLSHLIKIAKKRKYHIKYLGADLQGEAKTTAKKLVQIAKKTKKNTLIIGGGETTVKVQGKGYGGRNQELVLASLPYLTANMSVLSLATDGVDGFTPKKVAGAIIDARYQGKNIEKYLKNNDSYTFLRKIHSLLDTGLTGTNVGDIIMLLVK